MTKQQPSPSNLFEEIKDESGYIVNIELKFPTSFGNIFNKIKYEIIVVENFSGYRDLCFWETCFRDNPMPNDDLKNFFLQRNPNDDISYSYRSLKESNQEQKFVAKRGQIIDLLTENPHQKASDGLWGRKTKPPSQIKPQTTSSLIAKGAFVDYSKS